jgi:hypothetical protein
VVVEAGYSLLEMRPVGLSLEEIFLQLTRDVPSAPVPSDENVETGEIEDAPQDEVEDSQEK